MQNNRILVVDDNPAIHADFKKILHEGASHSAHLDSAEAILFGDVKGERTGSRSSRSTPQCRDARRWRW